MTSSQKNRIITVLISIFAGVIILGLKFWAAEITNSSALKSDAIESMVNVAAAVFALFAVLFADQPADDDHPYGHGKVEHFSSVFEGGLIAVAALFIIFEAGSAFLHGPSIQSLNQGLMINVLAGSLNGILGAYLFFTGKKLHSKAIEADGKHVLSDFLSTVGIFVGLMCAQVFQMSWLDPLLALGIGVVLGLTGFKMVHESANALLDNADPFLLKRVVEALNHNKTADLISVHELRILKSGRYVHVDIHMVVPEFYTVEKAHQLVETTGLRALQQLGIEGEFHTHTDPCQKKYCGKCQVENCPIRVTAFEGGSEITGIEAMRVLKPETALS
jgi:cation diffusion facilitator family transporter